MDFSNNLIDNNYLANAVYDVDPIKKVSNKRPQVGKIIRGNSTKYKILDISRDGIYGPHHKYGATNGMQAMTVAPVDKKGKVDYGHITIAYAGTNTGDIKDILTDIENVINGSKDYVGLSVKQSQFTTADGYMKYIKNKYGQKVPNIKISVTGHSLGGSLALAVGGKHHLRTVAFNGPFLIQGHVKFYKINQSY